MIDIETLRYWNEWSMLGYRVGVGLAMIPVAYAAYRVIRFINRWEDASDGLL